MPPKPKTIINGWVNLNKPSGMSSNAALSKVKRALGFPKIGHAGTLDPLASGILPLALGEATKLVQYMMDDDKIYTFTVTWGEQRTTDDSEGTIINTSPDRPTRTQIESLLPAFVGEISQLPPQYSALKIDGERAYNLAREGQTVELKPRAVHVYELTLVSATDDTATFRCVCGKGTYVRSLARDFGLKLGCFGYISALNRDAVGPFTLDNAISLDFFDEKADKTSLLSTVLPIASVLDDILVLDLNDGEAQKVRQGQKLTFLSRPQVDRLKSAGLSVQPSCVELTLATYRGEALALLEIAGVEAQPVRVFNV
jgi:tRNA pseudouridine55 synthase